MFPGSTPMNSSRCRIKPNMCYALALCLLVWLSSAAVAQSHFLHTSGKQLVDGAGHPLMLSGTNLGNWLVREGYMFHFEGGPQSAREIEALVNELLSPEGAAKFWKTYLDRYITRDDIQFLKRAGFNSIRVPIHYKYFESDNGGGFPPAGSCHRVVTRGRPVCRDRPARRARRADRRQH